MKSDMDYGTFYIPNDFGREFLGFEPDSKVFYVPDLKTFFNEIARNNSSMGCKVNGPEKENLMQPEVNYPLEVELCGTNTSIGSVTKRKMSSVVFE